MARRVIDWELVKQSGKLSCACCKIELPLSAFRPEGVNYRTVCISCREEARLKRLENMDNKIKYICRKAKARAFEKGYSFDLTPEFLMELYTKQNGVCYLSGMKLEVSGDGMISLDRVDSSKGYTQDNIRLCCLIINSIKTNLPLNKFLDCCRLVAANN